MQRIEQLTSGTFLLVLAASGFALAGEPVHETEPGQQPEGREQQTRAQQGGQTGSQRERGSLELDLSRDEIERLQRELASRGLYHGPFDGVAGPQTTTALREFHQQMGAPMDSGLDLQTRRALGLQLDRQNVSGDQTSPAPELERSVGREGEAPDMTGGETCRSQVQLSALPPEQIELLQTRLRELGFYPGPVDGKFGARTRSALQRFFQIHAGLASRGIITDTGAGMLGLPPGALDAAINARRAGVDGGPSRGLNGSAEMRSRGDSGSSSPEPGTTSAPQPSGGANALQRR